MKTRVIKIEIYEEYGRRIKLEMPLKHYDEMTDEEYAEGVADYRGLLEDDIQDAIDNLKKGWDEG